MKEISQEDLLEKTEKREGKGSLKSVKAEETRPERRRQEEIEDEEEEVKGRGGGG